MPFELEKREYQSPRWSYEIVDCSMPMSIDTYSNCGYQCAYCFSQYQRSTTHLIVKADRGVELWTGYINWVYDQERFDSSLKKQAFYKGAFGFKREDIANVYDGACALVDMSIIAGDGGGTQYTFLEAIDFGADCILASDWYAGPRSEMKPGVHYHQVGNVKELQGAIDKVRHGGPVLQCAAKDILVSHDAEQIARQYIELL